MVAFVHRLHRVEGGVQKDRPRHFLLQVLGVRAKDGAIAPHRLLAWKEADPRTVRNLVMGCGEERGLIFVPVVFSSSSAGSSSGAISANPS